MFCHLISPKLNILFPLPFSSFSFCISPAEALYLLKIPDETLDYVSIVASRLGNKSIVAACSGEEEENVVQ